MSLSITFELFCKFPLSVTLQGQTSKCVLVTIVDVEFREEKQREKKGLKKITPPSRQPRLIQALLNKVCNVPFKPNADKVRLIKKRGKKKRNFDPALNHFNH